MVECSMQFFQLTGTYLITVLDLVAIQSFPVFFPVRLIASGLIIDNSYVIDINSTMPQTDIKFI